MRLTRGQLADLAGCSLNTIFLIEQRAQEPSLSLARRLAVALKVEISEIFP